MKLYRIDRKGLTNYDEYDGMIIRAKSEEQVRIIAADKDSYSKQVWLNPKRSTIKRLKHKGKEKVLLASFNEKSY